MSSANKSEESLGEMLPWRVAWVAPMLGRGGRPMYMGPLLQALSKRVREFHAFVAEYGGNVQELGFPATIAGRILRFYLPHPKGIWYARGVFTLITPGILRKLAHYAPNVMLLNEFSLTTLYGLWVARRRTRSRVVLLVEARPWGLKGTMPRHSPRLIWRSWIARSADAVLTNNSDGYDYLTRILGVDPERVVTRPYLVSEMPAGDTTTLLQRFSNLRAGAMVEFLYVGRLGERKGLQDAIAAIALLSADERKRLKFHVVGEGDFRPALESQVRSLKLESAVIFHGGQPYNALHHYYSLAHVFLFPTHRDYRALAPFEALSAALPIIGSVHDGGVSETVIDGENGFRVDPFDHAALVGAIRTILQDPSVLHSFAKRSLEISRAYTVNNAVTALLQACDTALHS